MTVAGPVGTVVTTDRRAIRRSAVVAGGVVEMDPNLVETAAQFLAASRPGDLVAESSDWRLTEVPEDRVDLRRLVADLEDARLAFDRRLAEGLDGAVARLRAAAAGARAA